MDIKISLGRNFFIKKNKNFEIRYFGHQNSLFWRKKK